MNTPLQAIDLQLARAALLRANGVSWDAVAAALDRTADEVEDFANHPKWPDLIRLAEWVAGEETDADARLLRRRALRSGDEKKASAAADTVYRLAQSDPPRGPARKPLDEAVLRYFEVLNGMSPEEFAAWQASAGL